MQYLTGLLISVCVLTTGCDTGARTLDWNKTAKQQGFEVGEVIIVEGIVFDPIGFDFRFDLSDTKNMKYVKTGWESKTHTEVYYDSEENRSLNAPISVVVGTIYNPSAFESLQRLDDMYPDESSDYPHRQHIVRVTGEIYSFEKKFKKSLLDNHPDRYLSCVRIEVANFEVLHSEPFPDLIEEKSDN